MNQKLFDSQCYAKCGADFLHFIIRKAANVISEHGFLKTDQLIAKYSAVVFDTFSNANLDLCGEAAVIGSFFEPL